MMLLVAYLQKRSGRRLWSMASRMQLLLLKEVQGSSWGSLRKGRSRSRKDIECHHCGKRGHIKRDFYAFKREQKEKKKDANQEEEVQKNDKGKAKIEEINAVTSAVIHEPDGDVLFMSSLHAKALATSNDGYS